MAKTVTVSIENLLGYVEGNKLGHDNTEMLNTFLSFYKGGWYGHEYKAKQNNENGGNEGGDGEGLVELYPFKPVDLYDNP